MENLTKYLQSLVRVQKIHLRKSCISYTDYDQRNWETGSFNNCITVSGMSDITPSVSRSNMK